MPGDEQAPADGGAVDVAELERLAKAATPGDWQAESIEELTGPFFHYVGGEQVFAPGWDVRGPIRLGNHESGAITEADAKYIAAVQPKTVLALLAELARARRERDEARDLLYRMARLIRNTGALPASTWGARGGELLIELREKDPERYNREVKALAASAPAAGQAP